MAKTLDQVKSALKLRAQGAQVRENSLTLRLGVRKYVLPFENVRLLTSDEYVFIHIPPTAELLKISEGSLDIVADDETAEKAFATFKRSKRRSSPKNGASKEIPDEVLKAFEKVPPGYKVGYDATGKPKLIRARQRKG